MKSYICFTFKVSADLPIETYILFNQLSISIQVYQILRKLLLNVIYVLNCTTLYADASK